MMNTLLRITTVGLLAAAPALADEAPRITVRPDDTGQALANPGMGWVFHHYDNSIHGYGPPLGDQYAGEDFPGLRVAYLRLAWSYLEPQEGQFHWSIIDSVAQRYRDAGRDIAFRFTCFETEIPFATPEWVKDAGAHGYWWVYGKGCVDGPEADPHARWEPDYDDPVFLEKLDRFLQAASARYDGLPHVAFVDIGSLGVWGEGHPCARDYPLSTYVTHIDLHAKHFRKSLLVGMDDWRPIRTLDQPGDHCVAFEIAAPPELCDRPLQIRAGLWIPGEGGRAYPDGRLLPANAASDRRVLLGSVTVRSDGTAEFVPEPPPPLSDQQPHDVALEPVRFFARGDRWLLEVNYRIARRLPDGITPFCHLSDGPTSILAGCWEAPLRNEALDYARSRGATMRDDSIIWRQGVTFDSDWLAEPFWADRPVIIESGHYSANDWGDGTDYFRAIEAYRASYVSIHGDPHRIWADHQDVIPQMNRRIGYRIQLVEANWPATVRAGVPFDVIWSWRNVGVAKCLPGGYPALTFKRDGAIVAVLTANQLNMRDLPAVRPENGAAVHRTQFVVPAQVKPGDCEVFVSVGLQDGTPVLALPLDGDDGHRRYRLGTLAVGLGRE